MKTLNDVNMSTRTKFILTYLGGVLTGIILTFVLAFMVTYQGNSSSLGDDIVMFEKPQQEIKATSFEVMQVLPNGSALARVEDMDNFGMIVLFLADKGTSYYDDQKIDVPSGKKVMQVGTYKYVTRSEMEKTVPVVEILDK